MRIVLVATLLAMAATACDDRNVEPAAPDDAGQARIYSAPTKVLVPAGEQGELDATCDVGESMVAGGCSSLDPGMSVMASYPVILAGGNADAWHCVFYNGSSEEQYGKAHIVCRNPSAR